MIAGPTFFAAFRSSEEGVRLGPGVGVGEGVNVGEAIGDGVNVGVAKVAARGV